MEESQFSRKTTVVIATMNEEKNLPHVLPRLKSMNVRILIVDGHSTDRTCEIGKQFGAEIVQDRGRGKGDALRCAIPYIQTEWTVFMDADGSHDPQDIPKLLKPLLRDEADHVTGSRLMGGSSELHGGFDEFLRLTGSSFITACINWRFAVRLSDSQNGFRAIKTEVLKKLDLREDLTTIEQEMIIRTLRLGYRMGEVPSHEYQRLHGDSHIHLSKVWFQYGWALFKNLFLR